MYDQSMSVSDANRYIKMLMDNDAVLSSISVKGEISNLKYHTSGHLYFTLKDQDSELAAVMFRSAASNLNFIAKNGMQVRAYGKISIYEKSGKCQIYVSAMVDDGIGRLQLEYERLFRKLSEEGLFSDIRKRPIPRIPECIGIITSPTGAALRDMINVTGRRWPSAKILLYPSLVQGIDAPASLCAGLACLNALRACDVIIIGRGGGSIEDLWAFNDESVARAVAASEIPVISAVGHETDFTLCDFAADKRAPTPSAAAELAVPDRNDISQRVDDAFGRVEGAFLRCFAEKRSAIESLSKQIELASPEARLESSKKELRYRYKMIESRVLSILQKKNDELAMNVGKLEAINPLAVLSRGFSVTKNKDGAVVSSVSKLKIGETVNIQFADGFASADVTAVNKTVKRAKKEKNNV